MSAPKHTPGPWSVGGTFNPNSAEPYHYIWSEPAPGMQSGRIVAKEVRPADARLITAAPEMLALLRVRHAAGHGGACAAIRADHRRKPLPACDCGWKATETLIAEVEATP